MLSGGRIIILQLRITKPRASKGCQKARDTGRRGGVSPLDADIKLFSSPDKTLHDACTGCASFSKSALSVCSAIWPCTPFCPPLFVPSLLLLSPCRADVRDSRPSSGASFGRWSGKWKKINARIAYGEEMEKEEKKMENKEQDQTRGG